MNTMLQLEQALNDQSLMAETSPPVSAVETCAYSFSPPTPQYMSTTCMAAAAAGYQDVYYSAAMPAGYGSGGVQQLQEYVMSSPCDDADGAGGGAGLQGSSSDAVREMIFRIAALQPVNIDLEAVRPPKRRNVRTSKDPQSVAARQRRERIRILQRLVLGGTKMDTASMLDEAIHYVKFLKSQVQSLELAAVATGAAAFGAVAYPALQHAPW